MSRTTLLQQSLEKFYTEPENKRALDSVLSRDSDISLRNLEWFITKFSKERRVRYTTGEGREFDVHLGYKSSLGGYSKKLFDPFCRADKFDFMGHRTTVAQLNFIRWCINNDIFQYMRNNKVEIMPQYSHPRSGTQDIS